MLLVKDMPDVYIHSVIWDPFKDSNFEFNTVEYFIYPIHQIILEKQDIELHMFGVQRFSYQFPDYENISKMNTYDYIIKTKKANFYFKNKKLADEYYNMIVYHFFS